MKASGGTAGYFMLSALTCIGLASPDASKKSAKKPFKPREHVVCYAVPVKLEYPLHRAVP